MSVKLTKTELKGQKDALRRFLRYLPTLQLKKQQLQSVMTQIDVKLRELEAERAYQLEQAGSWIGVFADPLSPELANALRVDEVHTVTGNIAGIEIPVFDSISIEEQPGDLWALPFWVDGALDFIRELLERDAKIHILYEQRRRIAEELRITSQRVNLFEKVKIPETRENIRLIQIYLGDQQTAAVVRGKIAKSKLAGEVSV